MPSASTPFSSLTRRLVREAARIVRHQDDRLAQAGLQHLQKVENLLGRVAVQIAGRLVGHDQRGIGDQRPGNANALLFAAR